MNGISFALVRLSILTITITFGFSLISLCQTSPQSATMVISQDMADSINSSTSSNQISGELKKFQLMDREIIHTRTLLQMLFTMLPLSFFILHISLYAFHSQIKDNLYYAVYLFFISITVFIIWETHLLHRNQYLLTFSTYTIVAARLSLLRYFYHLAYDRLPAHFWGLAILVTIPEFVEYKPLLIFELLYCLVCYWLFTKMIRNRIELAWFILISGVFLITNRFVDRFLILFFDIHSNLLNFGYPIAHTFFVFSMSIVLSLRFSKVYRELNQLNVELEDRVDQRTQELNTMNVELQQANAQLVQIDQMKTQFVSQASHDLRTPLTAIKGSLDNLLMGIAGALSEKQAKIMTRATTSVDRLTNLINDVLDLNRIETGRIVLEKTDIPFKALVENIINENRPAAEQKQITINANLGEEITLHIDGSKIERVVGELISNAIKYTPKSGIVNLKLSRECDTVLFSVADSGIGMTKEECSKIWERFYRTSASKTFAKGSGLGLSIAKELVELHKGMIELVSEQGRGTTFTLSLPVKGA
jgi:signal transduction histidine kinase